MTAAPAVLGFRYTFGGGSLRYSDVALVATALWCLPVVLKRRGIGLVQALTALMLLTATVGALQGTSIRWEIRDLRPVSYMLFGAILGIYILADRANWRWNLRLTTWLLGITAILVVLSQFTSVALVGNSSDDATIFIGSSPVELSSRRAQITTDPLALFVLCAIFGAFLAALPIRDRLGRRTYGVLLASTTVIIFLSYSRNTILALGVVFACAMLAPTGVSYAQRWLNTLTVCLFASIVLIPLVYVALGAGFAQDALSTFSTRVIGGLSSNSLANDASVHWRQLETRLAWQSIDAHPFFGNGLGVFYRQHIDGEPFAEAGGRLYVHNYYLWVLVKGGFIYLLAIVAILGGALIRLLFMRPVDPADRPLRVAAGCGIAAVVAAAFVAPWPSQPSMAATLGALLAVAWAAPALGAARHESAAKSRRARERVGTRLGIEQSDG